MLWPLILTVAGLLAAFLPVSLGLPDLPDFVAFALLGGGLLWGWITWRRRKGKLRFVAATGQTLLAGMVVFWAVFSSAYTVDAEAPAVGAPAPDIAGVRVRDGASFHLAAQRGHGVLLVFFRGMW